MSMTRDMDHRFASQRGRAARHLGFAVAVVIATAGIAVAVAFGQTPSTQIDWTSVASQPFVNSEAQGAVVGARLYSFGGFDSTKTCCVPTNRAYVFDPALDTWTAIRSMPAMNGTGRGGVTHAGMAADDVAIYFAGGYTHNAAGTGQIFGTKEVWRYDVASDTYSRLPDLPVARAAGQLELLAGKLHHFGGTNEARSMDTPEHFVLNLTDTAAGWTTKAPLPDARHHLGSAVLGGKIYAIGGQHGHDATLTTRATVEAYDPSTDRWTARAPLPVAIGHISGATFEMDGRIIVLGGETAHNAVIANARAYDPVTNAWTALTSLPAPRRSGVADVIAGAIYYSTGSDSKITWRGTPTNPNQSLAKLVNFQPSGSALPSGYEKDYGLAFDAGRGSGWVTEASLSTSSHVPVDISPNTRERNAVAEQRLDTLIHMQYPSALSSTAVKTPAAWELVVPDGSYAVTVSVGDAAATDSTHRIRVEGDVVIAGFVPTSSTRFAQASRTVSVSDGRLTIDAIGGTNTKLNYVDVRSVRGTV